MTDSDLIRLKTGEFPICHASTKLDFAKRRFTELANQGQHTRLSADALHYFELSEKLASEISDLEQSLLSVIGCNTELRSLLRDATTTSANIAEHLARQGFATVKEGA